VFENSFNVSTGTKVAEKIINVQGARYAIAEVTIETDANGNGVARMPFASGVAMEYGVALGTGGFAPTTPFTVTITTEKFGQTVTLISGVSVSSSTIASLGAVSSTHEVSGLAATIPAHVCGPLNISIAGAGAHKRVTVGLMLSRMR